MSIDQLVIGSPNQTRERKENPWKIYSWGCQFGTHLPPSRKLQTLSSLFDTNWNVSLMICCCMSSFCGVDKTVFQVSLVKKFQLTHEILIELRQARFSMVIEHQNCFYHSGNLVSLDKRLRFSVKQQHHNNKSTILNNRWKPVVNLSRYRETAAQ